MAGLFFDESMSGGRPLETSRDVRSALRENLRVSSDFAPRAPTVPGGLSFSDDTPPSAA